MHTIFKLAALAGLAAVRSASTSHAKFSGNSRARDLPDTIGNAVNGDATRSTINQAIRRT